VKHRLLALFQYSLDPSNLQLERASLLIAEQEPDRLDVARVKRGSVGDSSPKGRGTKVLEGDSEKGRAKRCKEKSDKECQMFNCGKCGCGHSPTPTS
jgi:hypothetical protein